MNKVTLGDLGILSTKALEERFRAVCSLIDFGFYVYPCYAISPFGCSCKLKHKEKKEWGKHPTGRSSHKIASRDPRVKTWWVENPYDNVAINPQFSGCVVIDVDPRSGGHNSWIKFLEDFQIEIPNTVQTLTGIYDLKDGSSMRGFHLWFRVTEDSGFVQNLNHLGYDGIDIKYNGGVMAPPSNHSSGVSYEWAAGNSPTEIDIAELPTELGKKIRRKQSRLFPRDQFVGYALPSANPKESIEQLLSTPLYEGNRVVGLYKLASQVAYRLGVETPEKEHKVLEIMLNYNASMVHPPLELGGADAAEKHILNAIEWIAGQTNDRR